ncbi:hypothetical protein NQ314_002706 [Rhamnusium bicolor]|uniref:Sulfotransferase n=1 Tax=Rhamnusium bicolor TaxID=1586634 RepID=A0AAV8ZR07_9CUCU|nr:hypothetical protein NQ314_002706 [Rhamnusium bicolor]
MDTIEDLIYEIYDVIRKEAIPLSFDRHVYFINFTSFDKQLPTYVNLIRDPIDKIISRLLNNEWALQTAKNNVERYYPVVGVLEELNATLEILEHNIPYFFKGAQRVYHRDLLKIYKIKKKSEVVRMVHA